MNIILAERQKLECIDREWDEAAAEGWAASFLASKGFRSTDKKSSFSWLSQLNQNYIILRLVKSVHVR